MSATVRVPTPLRSITGSDRVTAEGDTIKEIIDDLDEKYGGVKERLYDENGQIRRFINIYLNDVDIRFRENTDTTVKDGEEISIVPAIAGG